MTGRDQEAIFLHAARAHPGARRIHPDASRVLSVPDRPNDPWRAEPVASFRRGDILLFRAWFDDAYNAKVKSIYQEAGRP